MRALLAETLAQSDIVVATGGLGPTQDDLTKEIIADVLGAELVLDEKALADIEGFFKRFGNEMTENNRKQAYLPAGCRIYYNEVGTAPGFCLEKDGKAVIALPGPPRELKHLYEKWVRPWLTEKTNASIYNKVLRFYGIGESTLETKLAPVIEGQTDPTVATYAKEGEVSVRVASKRATVEEAAVAVQETIDKIYQIAGKYLYSTEDQELHEVVASRLLACGGTLASAESCTGGMFAERILSVPGMSASYLAGLVTYSNEMKTELLGVPAALIEKHGAVSEEVASAMATGVKARTGADYAVAVTGVAGPDGGSEAKPVGSCWISLAQKGMVITLPFETRDRGRQWNRNIFVLAMLDLLNKALLRQL
jgi:nicotinamide-nucleotide amidase